MKYFTKTSNFWEKAKARAQHLGETTTHRADVFHGGRESENSLGSLQHDLSKYAPPEFGPYADYWYGSRSPEVKKKFQKATQHHYRVNPHHYEARTDQPLKIQIEHLTDMGAAAKRAGETQPSFSEGIQQLLSNPSSKGNNLFHLPKSFRLSYVSPEAQEYIQNNLTDKNRTGSDVLFGGAHGAVGGSAAKLLSLPSKKLRKLPLISTGTAIGALTAPVVLKE